MDRFAPLLLLLVVVIGLASMLGVAWRRLQRTSSELEQVEGEEERMFDYLHELGSAIGPETTQASLCRTIVDGLTQVVGGDGGAVYLLDESGLRLEPAHLSEDCPPLIGVPVEVRRRAERDRRSLSSYLRLNAVESDRGVFGEVLASGEPLTLSDLASHPSFRDAFADYAGGEVAAMVSPLRHGGKDLGVLAVARRGRDCGFTANDFAVFRSAAEQSAFALGNAMIYREAEEKRQFESDLRNASEVQRVLLPQGEPKVPGYRIHGANVPARIISGDYYDHLDLGAGLHGMVIADVSGKGVAAGLLMAMCRSVLRAEAAGDPDPAAVLAAVNRQLFPDIREDMFISLFYGVIEGDEGRLRVARAGHDAALWFRAAAGEVEEVRPPGLALGIDDGEVFERVTRSVELRLAAGDVLLFHTDGVKEAVDAEGEEFGVERLREAFVEQAPMGAEAVVSGLQRELARFVGGAPQMDDVTLLALEKR